MMEILFLLFALVPDFLMSFFSVVGELMGQIFGLIQPTVVMMGSLFLNLAFMCT